VKKNLHCLGLLLFRQATLLVAEPRPGGSCFAFCLVKQPASGEAADL